METTTQLPTVLSNGKASFSLQDTKTVYGADLTDRNNEPRCFNQTSRSLRKAWAALCAQWTESMGMYEAMRVLQAHGVRMHSYCAMD